MNLAAILDKDQPVPGTPTAKWGYDPSIRAGYLTMSDDAYFAFGAVSSSLLKCPTLSEMYSLLTAPQKDTAALAIGTLADLAIVSGMEHVAERFALVDVPVNPTTGKAYGRDSKKAVEAYAAATAANPSKFVASLDEWDVYRAELDEIVTAFKASALCVASIQNAMLQVVGIMWHPTFQCWVKWKPDVLPTKPDAESGWAIRDLKTSRHHVLKFSKDCWEFDYFGQALWYSHNHEVCMALLGLELVVSNFDFIVVSKSDDSRKPRKAMARMIRVPLSPSINRLMEPANTRLLPADGMGRVEMFLSGLREHMEANPAPDDTATLSRIWTAFDHESQPFVLCELPRGDRFVF